MRKVLLSAYLAVEVSDQEFDDLFPTEGQEERVNKEVADGYFDSVRRSIELEDGLIIKSLKPQEGEIDPLIGRIDVQVSDITGMNLIEILNARANPGKIEI